MTVSQLEGALGEEEWYYWRAFEAKYGLRDQRYHDGQTEEWVRSDLLRSLLFELGSQFVKWKDKASAIRHYFPEIKR